VGTDSSTVDEAHFRRVLGHFPTGVTVIAAISDGVPAGLAVGSFFSVSLDPPLVGFCAGRSSSSWPAIEAAGVFCVSVLAEDQEEVCRRFATKGTDKFAGLGYTTKTATGSPRLEGALAWIDCELDAVHDGGDHVIAVGRVLELEVAHEGGPLLFFRGGYGRFGQ
jgi:flavin reductase (DIM6/NTAB) family NADH-FMN oxidoreductase RutF